ncbi:hypothetical protein ACXR2U_13135 [Jatrophihabitans sp. YIM 134969]
MAHVAVAAVALVGSLLPSATAAASTVDVPTGHVVIFGEGPDCTIEVDVTGFVRESDSR